MIQTSMNKEAIFAFVENLIDLLTLRRVSLLSLLSSICIVLFVMFENRAAIFATLYKSAERTALIEWSLSNESKAEISNLTSIHPVGIVMLSDVDLKKNRRTVKAFYARDAEIDKQLQSEISKVSSIALFDFDAKNTEQMVAMLNNEFLCVPTIDVVYNKIFANLSDRFPITCAVAVPPFFGEFVGYITIILFDTPSQLEVDALKIEANKLAVDIYFRDVSKKYP